MVEAGNVVNYLVRLDIVQAQEMHFVMDKYGSLLASVMGRVFGETRFAVLVCLATCSREDSGVDVLEDEYNLTRKMQGAGFRSNANIHQELLDGDGESTDSEDCNYRSSNQYPAELRVC